MSFSALAAWTWHDATPTVAFLVAAALGLFFTPRMREAAERFGIVDQPDGRLKTQRAPVAYLGGLAIYLAFLVTLGTQSATGSVSQTAEALFHWQWTLLFFVSLAAGARASVRMAYSLAGSLLARSLATTPGSRIVRLTSASAFR